MEHSIAKTSVLGAVPAAVWTGIQLAPGALVVGNMFWSAYGVYSGYQKVKGLKDWLATGN